MQLLTFPTLSCLVLFARALGDEDAAALVQTAVNKHAKQGMAMEEREQEGAEKGSAPMIGTKVLTKTGPLEGVFEDGVTVFKSVPYAEKPQPFQKAEPVRPWRGIKSAQSYQKTCIGGGSNKISEGNDCLRLNIWAPLGGKKLLPVIVFLHGGQNQHGSSQDPLRSGSTLIKSQWHPVVFVSVDYRLGVYGWASGHNATPNLGLHDQILALRWVRDNIEAFGGNPSNVTLEGEGDAAHNVIAHLVSPLSQDLFSRAVLFSPPANLWSRQTNELRTDFLVRKTGCFLAPDKLACLALVPYQQLLSKELAKVGLMRDWAGDAFWKEYKELQKFERKHEVSEDSPTYFGWHPVVDGDVIPAEPRELIRKGAWNRVPVLITLSKNETMGLISEDQDLDQLQKTIAPLFPEKDYQKVAEDYYNTLFKSGIRSTDQMSLFHQIATDKLFTCDVRSLASDISIGGGMASVVIFWHSPPFDPVGRETNSACVKGATCHLVDLFYAIPQKDFFPKTAVGKAEAKLATAYSEAVLTFIYGQWHPFSQFEMYEQEMVHYGIKGLRYAPYYRKAQCDILDTSVGENLPDLAKGHAIEVQYKNAMAAEYKKQMAQIFAPITDPETVFKGIVPDPSKSNKISLR